jgi:ATP-binding cassette, subfamily B, bacterial
MAKILPFTTASPACSTQVRRLAPNSTQLRRGPHESLECEITGEGLYRGVRAVMLFPISQPDHWISLCHTDDSDKEKEIGIIETLSDHSSADQQLIRDSLCKHYYVNTIIGIKSIKQKFGQLFFMVDTSLGMKEFVTPWRSDRAEDYGANGKVILDALNNRYLIPDMETLSPRERRLVSTYIYW